MATVQPCSENINIAKSIALNLFELNAINLEESIHQESKLSDRNTKIKEIIFKLAEISNQETVSFDGKSEDDMKKIEKSDVSNESDDNLDDIPTNRQTTEKITKKRPKPPVIFRCEICQEEFENENILKEHLDTHDFKYFCETCNAKFKLAINFIDHIREHRTDKLYKCALCEFTAERRPKITLHLRTKHDQFKKYRCKECKKGTNVYTHFLEHKFIHSQQKPFKCDKCTSAFPQKTALNAHHIRMHTFNPVSCEICQKECRNKMELRSHKSSHEKQSATCDKCGKCLSSKDKLRIHMRIHTGEKPYPCRYCDKAFKTSTFRSDHERIHTGEKPHICSICKKGFSQRTSMKVHETTHSTEKPFECIICGKLYKSKIMLNGHVKKCTLKSPNELSEENMDSIQRNGGSTPIIGLQDILQSNCPGQMYAPNNFNPIRYHNEVGLPNMLKVHQPTYRDIYNDSFYYVPQYQEHRNVFYHGCNSYHIILPEEADLEQAQENYQQ